MRRRGSYIAGEIMREYKQRKAFEKKQRANCKDKDCGSCEYSTICSVYNDGTQKEEM